MESHKSELQIAAKILGIPVAGAVDIAGVVGNLALFVLLRSSSKTSLYCIIGTLSLVDMVTLAHNLFFQVLPLACELSEAFEHVYRAVSPAIALSWPLAMASHMASIWLTVLISAERWIAVCKPLYRHRLVTVTRTRVAVAGILIMSVVYNVPRFLEYRYSRVTDNEEEYDLSLVNETTTASYYSVGELFWQKSDVGRSDLYAYGYGVVMYALFVFLIPFVLITIFNLWIITELRNSRQVLSRLSTQQQHEQRMTLMPIYIALLFCVFETPAFLINVADATGAIAYAGWQLALVCSTLLVMVNAATNFLIYCVCTKRFRKVIKHKLCCRQQEDKAIYSSVASHGRLMLQPVKTIEVQTRRTKAVSVVQRGNLPVVQLRRKLSVTVLQH